MSGYGRYHQHVRDNIKLTDRQAHILLDRIHGHSWRTIADAYHITEATARGHHKAALARIEAAALQARKELDT
jgi:DNA-binding NarL/FixJ family response regulator